jgi:hypothetical protein
VLTIAVISLPQQIVADVPPPIESIVTDSGGLYTTATNISMPYAEVNASIHLSGSWSYNISVSCSFYLLSLTTQNLTTAFVYPSVWSSWYDDPLVLFDYFTIHANGSLLNHTILSYDDFKFRYDSNQTDWDKVDDCDFAAFNFSIDAAEPIFIDVNIEFTTDSQAHDFVFDYIVDTARGWEGDTHEIVNIDFKRDIDTEIIRYSWYPNDSLVVMGNNYTADVTWDFHISSFQYDRVTFIVQQQEHPTYHGSLPPNPYFWVPTAVLVTAVILILFGLRVKGRL